MFEGTTIDEVGTTTAGGSVVNAGNLEQAVALAKICPSIQDGGGVQVGELAEWPPDHPAARRREAADQQTASAPAASMA